MSLDKLKGAIGTPDKPLSIFAQIDKMRPQFAAALPKHLNADRMVRIAFTELRKTPDLQKCEPTTTLGALITLSQLGLEPGVLGQAYLVPFNNKRKHILECQAIPGWKGYVDLVSRAGRASVSTGAVRENDEFDYDLGSKPYVHYKKAAKFDVEAPFVYFWSSGLINGAAHPTIEVWTADEVEAHRDRFNRVGDRHYSYQHWGMYGRKIPLLQVIKYMPVSVELQQPMSGAMTLDNKAEAGHAINMQQAADKSWEMDTGDPASESSEPQGDTTSDVKAIDEAISEIKTFETLEAVDKGRADFLKRFPKGLPLGVEGALGDRLEKIKQETAKR